MNSSDPTVRAMLDAAIAASSRAYCRYSKFPVGAAVLTESGAIFAGCNVENASFGLTICAERVAIYQAVAAGERRITAVAVYTPTASPTPPCGACRQVIHEFGPDADVFCFGSGDTALHFKLDQLLPGAFGPDHLSSEPGQEG